MIPERWQAQRTIRTRIARRRCGSICPPYKSSQSPSWIQPYTNQKQPKTRRNQNPARRLHKATTPPNNVTQNETQKLLQSFNELSHKYRTANNPFIKPSGREAGKPNLTFASKQAASATRDAGRPKQQRLTSSSNVGTAERRIEVSWRSPTWRRQTSQPSQRRDQRANLSNFRWYWYFLRLRFMPVAFFLFFLSLSHARLLLFSDFGSSVPGISAPPFIEPRVESFLVRVTFPSSVKNCDRRTPSAYIKRAQTFKHDAGSLQRTPIQKGYAVQFPGVCTCRMRGIGDTSIAFAFTCNSSSA